MDSTITSCRDNVIWAINQNPVTITITRKEKIKTEGHFIENISQFSPLTVRIFQMSRNIKIESQIIGTREIDTGWGLLADWQADLRAGPNVQDEFEVPGMGYFVIKAVYPQKIHGQIIGYQAELRRIQ